MALKRFIKAISCIIICLLAFSLASGCKKQKQKVGFIPMNMDDEYYITMVNAAKKEAEKQGIELIVQAETGVGETDKQSTIIENMIDSKVKAICIVPGYSDGLIDAVKKAQEADIPVVTLDIMLDTDSVSEAGLDVVPYIGADNYAGAELAGEYVDGIMDEEDKIAVLTGRENDKKTIDIKNGFHAKVANNLIIETEESANWEIEQGYNVAKNIIENNPDISFIFAFNDDMAMGALSAVKETGKEIMVMGFDGSDDALQSIKDNGLKATVAKYPDKIGIEGIKAAKNLIDGMDVNEETLIDTIVINEDNIDEYLDSIEQYSS